MDGAVGDDGQFGHLEEDFLGEAGAADAGEGGGQHDGVAKAEDFLQEGGLGFFQDELDDDTEGDFLAVEVGVGARVGGEGVVDGVGSGEACGFKAETGKEGIGLDDALEGGVICFSRAERRASTPSARRVR